MSLCKDCFSGVTYEGTAKGKIEEIGGVRCYVAVPEVEYPKDNVVLFFSDLYGIDFINNQLLADDFARNGFKVIAPDYLHGDPGPATALDPGSTFDVNGWFAKHDVDTTVMPLVDKIIVALRDESEHAVKRIGVTGYCFGARPAFNYALKNEVDVVVVSHPSLLKVPEDFEAYKLKSKAPLLMNTGEFDTLFPIPSRDKAVEILGNGKFSPGFEWTYWPGCRHGFAVRGDLSNPLVKAGKEGAFKAAVEFFEKHL
ncbi:alpha/beta-hydrolase [Panus rudis PR-1116 ss-1]|nr:alpha/beta-hydrolase [Panus rudis PR-1116 ss-1]